MLRWVLYVVFVVCVSQRVAVADHLCVWCSASPCWRLEASGFGNGECDACDWLNGTWHLNYVSEFPIGICQWAAEETWVDVGCVEGGVSSGWTLGTVAANPGVRWVLGIYIRQFEEIRYEAVLPTGEGCGEPIVLSLVSSGAGCTCPPTLTIVPYGSPEYDPVLGRFDCCDCCEAELDCDNDGIPNGDEDWDEGCNDVLLECFPPEGHEAVVCDVDLWSRVESFKAELEAWGIDFSQFTGVGEDDNSSLFVLIPIPGVGTTGFSLGHSAAAVGLPGFDTFRSTLRSALLVLVVLAFFWKVLARLGQW